MLDFDILDTVAGKQVYDEGREKGREEGIEKGREEGLVNMREMLALNIQKRFGDVSSDIMTTIYSIRDFEYLKDLFSASYSYEDYDLLKKKLKTIKI